MDDLNKTQLGTAPVADPNRTIMGSAPTLNATITIKPVQCPICKTFNPVGVMFCVDCGLIFDSALPADAFGAPAVQLPVLVDAEGKEHPLRPGANSIGRQGDVLIDDQRISRRHAQIDSDGNTFTVQDLGSTNGTTLNGAPLTPNQPQAMNAGDKLSLGGFELTLSLPGEAQKTMIGAGGRTAAISAPPTAEDAPAFLIGDGRRFPLHSGAQKFGRKADNPIQIANAYVSGVHGEIEVAEDGIYLTDLGSTNGTVLNESKLPAHQRTLLQPADVIRLGELEFRVEHRTAAVT